MKFFKTIQNELTLFTISAPKSFDGDLHYSIFNERWLGYRLRFTRGDRL
jgi:hypothetical protein